MNLKHNGKVQASFKGVVNPLELPQKKSLAVATGTRLAMKTGFMRKN